MKLYKFRPLLTCCNYDRVISILRDGFYCCSFLDFNDVNEGVFPVTENTVNMELNHKLEYRICSFSEEEALSSQLMWGHYAEAGMGVAIEVVVSPTSPFEKVHYDRTNRHNSIKEILTNKSSQWKYEKERRLLLDTQDDYYKADITKIYFGTPYQKLTNYNEIRAKNHKLREYHQRLEMLKVECDNRTVPIPYEEYHLV